MVIPPAEYNRDMVRSRVRILLAEKSYAENRKISYRTFAAECGVSTNIVTSWMNDDFERVDKDTLRKFCAYFNCGVGEVLENVTDEQ